MKKLVIIIAGIVLLLVVILVAIPVIFKPALINAAKSTLAKQFNAEVEFEGYKLSLIRSFPKVSLELQNVTVSGKGEFQPDTLLTIKNARAKMSLMSLFKKAGRSIEEINLVQPKLNLIKGKTGNANWDITNEPEAGPGISANSQQVNQEEPFTLQLEKIEIKNGSIIYNDRETNLITIFDEVNLDVKGKMYGTSTELLVDGKAERFSTDYKG